MFNEEVQSPEAPPEVPSRPSRKSKGPKRFFATRAAFEKAVEEAAKEMLKNHQVVNELAQQQLPGFFTDSCVQAFARGYRVPRAEAALLVYTPLMPGYKGSGKAKHFARQRRPRILTFNEAARALFWPDSNPSQFISEDLFTMQTKEKQKEWHRFIRAMRTSRSVSGNFTLVPRSCDSQNPLSTVTDARHFAVHLHPNAQHDNTVYSTLSIVDNTEEVKKGQLDVLVKQSHKKDYGDQCIAELLRTKTPFYIVWFDLDDFTIINKMLQHATADHILKIIGEKLHNRSRKHDVLIRWGGDEFVLLVVPTNAATPLITSEMVEHRRSEIVDHIDEPLHLELTEDMKPHWEKVGRKKGILLQKDGLNVTIRVGVSTGIAHITPDQNLTVEEAYNKASKAMFENKAQRKKAQKASSTLR